MTPVSPRRLPVCIRGNGIGCYRGPQQQCGVMGSSPGRGEVGGMRGAGQLGQFFSLLRLSKKMTGGD